jgi:uncharacterized protein involved in exopolysaccharide biosynthesis
MDRDTLLVIAAAGGFALGLMFAIGLAVSMYMKHRGRPDSSSGT